ncbi:enoyl-CoA hydratase-related protein [Nocardia niigatensis]
MTSQRILLLANAKNALTTAADLALRRRGFDVLTTVVSAPEQIAAAVSAIAPDVIIAPYLTVRIPREVWANHRACVVIHPGPIGDRGGASLDWAILDGEPVWGVIAISAVEEMDAGPVWAHRSFAMPQARKSEIYNGIVRQHALACILETADKALDPGFEPTPQDQLPRPVEHARTRPLVRAADRVLDWDAPMASVLATIRSADGAPGVVAEVAGRRMHLFDAHPDDRLAPIGVAPGTVTGRRHHAVRVTVGERRSIWIGHLRQRLVDNAAAVKAPAVDVLAHAGVDVAGLVPVGNSHTGWNDMFYHRQPDSTVATITFTTYNGTLTTDQCQRLAGMLRWASRQDIRVLILRGRGNMWCTGLHLGAIEISADSANSAWQNVAAINQVARAIVLCPKVVIASVDRDLGAGGAALAAAADYVVSAPEVTWNMHYATMGLTGFELHTYTLPRRCGDDGAHRLLTECRAIDALEAQQMGLVDEIRPEGNFDHRVDSFAQVLAQPERSSADTEAKRRRLTLDFATKPLTAYEVEELGRGSIAIFGGTEFARLRGEFLRKTTPSHPGQDALLEAAVR